MQRSPICGGRSDKVKNASNKHTTTAVASSRYKRGYIDKTGKFLIDPQFGVAESFSDSLARVGTYVQGLPQEHYIDRIGKYIWQPT